jgi:tRNA(Ile)-lysidine synthase
VSNANSTSILNFSNRSTSSFERLVYKGMLEAVSSCEVEFPDSILIACSGGPDSTALLIAMVKAFPESRYIAGYFNHKIRDQDETAREAHFVSDIASKLGIEFATGDASNLIETEEQARIARYKWLAEVCVENAISACVTGHHSNDQAETAFFNLIRGSGAKGFSAMNPGAHWPIDIGGRANHLRIMRPLLTIWQQDIHQYLNSYGIKALVDSTNEDTGLIRNRLRLDVIPTLKEINPGIEQHLVSLASDVRSDDQYLYDLAKEWLGTQSDVIERESTPDQQIVRIPRTRKAPIKTLAKPLFARILRIIADELGLKLSRTQIDTAYSIRVRSGGTVSLTGGNISTDAKSFIVSAVKS